MAFFNISFMEDIKNIIREIKDLKNSNRYINYSQYVAEYLDKNISYAEYVAENAYAEKAHNLSYSEYIAERIDKSTYDK